MLVQWGCSRADKAGLPGFLEASDAGRSLYESLGFVAEKETYFAMSKYEPGHDPSEKERNTVMLRGIAEPQK